MYTPDSVVYLCNVPLEADQKNQLHFSSVSAQTNYFESTVVKELTGFTFVRRDSAIRCPENIEDLYNCNYVMYQNSHFTDKWFYAFITELEYLNDAVTAIHIKTDVFQTWMFEAEILPSFVVREHTNNDAIGANTIPENLEIGPYMCLIEQNYNLNEGGSKIVVASQALTAGDSGGTVVDNVFSGVNYQFYDTTNYQSVNDFILARTEDNKADSIVAILQVPSFIESGGDIINAPSIPGSFQGYIPKNNKLYTFPYCYMGVTANMGEEKMYRFENFTNTPKFGLASHMSLNPTAILYPYDYLGIENDLSNSIYFQPFTQCSWTSNTFAQWYSARANQIGVGFAEDIIKTAVGVGQMVVSGGMTGAGGAISGITSIVNSLAQMEDIKTAAPRFNGANGNTGGAPFSWGTYKLTFKSYGIKAEYARCVDEFFSMFGYKTNRVKVPNIGTRQNWNYVQTVDIQITGAIPNDDMSELRDIYNSGVTIWNNPETFGDYSQNNGIVS